MNGMTWKCVEILMRCFALKGGYNSGGPGYVMSALNLNKLMESFSMPQCSQSSSGAEDIEIANCLRLVSRSPDTREIYWLMGFLKLSGRAVTMLV